MLPELETQWEQILGCHRLRDIGLGITLDEDLSLRLGGASMSLGELYVEILSIQSSYNKAIQSGSLRFDLIRNQGFVSVEEITRSFAEIDSKMKGAIDSVVSNPSEIKVMRPEGTVRSLCQHLEIYRQSMLMNLARLDLYFSVAGYKSTPAWRTYIGPTFSWGKFLQKD